MTSDRPDHHDVDMLLGDLQRDRTASLDRQAVQWIQRLAIQPWTLDLRDTLDALGVPVPGSVGLTSRVLERLAELADQVACPECSPVPTTPDDEAEWFALRWGLEQRRALALARLARGAYTPRWSRAIASHACKTLADLKETVDAALEAFTADPQRPELRAICQRSELFRALLVELCVARRRDEADAP